MITAENPVVQEVRSAINETAQAFHLSAVTTANEQLLVPCTYQILEPGFRPFRAGKASPEELQAELDLTISQAEERGISIGIEGKDSVTKLMLQQGLGIDCSNFAFRALSLAHDALNIPPYAATVFRDAAEIQALYGKGKWLPVDEDGLSRELLEEEARILDSSDLITIEWVCDVFGKDPEFVTGSAQICNTNATVAVAPEELLPGDLVAFRSASTQKISHVGVAEEITKKDGTVTVDFWHSWHTRDFASGLRRDTVRINSDDQLQWSHQGLGDTERYDHHSFRRPAGLALHYASLG